MFSVLRSIPSKSLEGSMAVLALNGWSISVGICQRHHRWLSCKRKGDFNLMYIQMSPSGYSMLKCLPLHIHIKNRMIDLGYISIIIGVHRVSSCTGSSSGLPEVVLFEQIGADMASFKVSHFTSRPDLLQTEDSGARYVSILLSLNHNDKTGIYRDWRERYE